MFFVENDQTVSKIIESTSFCWFFSESPVGPLGLQTAPWSLVQAAVLISFVTFLENDVEEHLGRT